MFPEKAEKKRETMTLVGILPGIIYYSDQQAHDMPSQPIVKIWLVENLILDHVELDRTEAEATS